MSMTVSILGRSLLWGLGVHRSQAGFGYRSEVREFGGLGVHLGRLGVLVVMMAARGRA
jgi:hypothetical protein